MNSQEKKSDARILVVDDHLAARQLYATYLRDNYEIVITESGDEALKAARKGTFDLYITDLMMPGMDGIALIKKLRLLDPDAGVIVCSQTEEIDLAVAAFRQKPLEFLRKPIRKNLLINAIERNLAVKKLRENISDLALLTSRDHGCPEPVMGDSPVMMDFWERVRKIAKMDLAAAVFITGETGCGKEVVARQLHRWSKRNSAPFVALNCGLLTPELAASELMGVSKGVATGVEPRKGKFSVADKGIIFLDEVLELPHQVQPMLLRLLQERVVTPVGSGQEIPVDVIVLAASNKDPGKSMAGGHFREDLFYRLSTVKLQIPPLRERREDIPALLAHLYHRHGGTGAIPHDTKELNQWITYDWPGNVRQLENALINRMIMGCPIDLMSITHTRSGTEGHAIELDSGLTWDEIRDRVFNHAMERAGGNIREAARRLNIPKSTLWEYLRRSDKKA
ncbi:sigma-54-dependent Fis family transcriptional regulator [bacterium]|nr:sigma-54-dependent Fis family transcriptional regulator [candidate division CSSED10-310 bacterium]